jgi:antitoxin component YwqK of YwqJK toxin-antitoxin module
MDFIYRFITINLLLICTTSSVTAQIQSALPISKGSDVDLSSYSGVISEHYANGSPFLWKTVKNGKAEGLWLEWYADGTLRYRANWKNAMGEGKWEYFFPNGKLRTESFYIEDKAYGIYRSYYENGQLQTDATFKDDKKVGIELIYNIDGTLQSRKNYEEGIQVIDQPLLFEQGKISSSQNNEWGIHFTPDGNTAYFTRRDAGTQKKRIYVTFRDEKGWSAPKIAPFSTAEDESPFINNQGDRLFFASFRPLLDGSSSQNTDMNIWFMDKKGSSWSDPKPLSNTINKSMKAGNIWPDNYEAGPTTDKAGNLYYWTKGVNTKATNLFFAALKSDGTFAQPIELNEPSSDKYFDSAPCLSPDGNLLFFASDNRPESWGTDLFYSRKVDGRWSKPKNMGIAINSYSDDSCPSFSPDGKYFFFSSNRAGNKDANGEPIWDLYYIETRFLTIE